MAFAQNSRSVLGRVAEVTFGTTPATPTLVRIPFKSHTLDLSKERLAGADIYADRMNRVDRHGNRIVGGSIEVDLCKGNYDWLLEAAFMNTFETDNELVPGTTLRYSTIEDGALDIAQFRRFLGMTVNSATFNIAPNQMVNTTFDMVGRDMTVGSSTIATTTTAATFNEPFDSFSGALFEGGIASGNTLCIVSSLSFSITNSISPNYVILCAANDAVAAQMEFGMCVVEGTMTVYYQDAVLLNKFLNETPSSLSVTVDDPSGANGYTFAFPRVKYNGAAIPVGGQTGPRMVELPFVALRDPSVGYPIKLTRTV